MNNKNLALTLFVIIAVSIIAFNNNISFKNLLKQNDYSPLGQKPSKVWVNTWETERLK